MKGEEHGPFGTDRQWWERRINPKKVRQCSSRPRLKKFVNVARHMASNESATEQSQIYGGQSGSSGERSSTVPRARTWLPFFATPSQSGTQVADTNRRGSGETVPTTGAQSCRTHRKDDRLRDAERGHALQLDRQTLCRTPEEVRMLEL